MTLYYRRDGTPYPEGPEGMREFAHDWTASRIVEQTALPNGAFISTAWLGIDHNFFGRGRPLIFETMVFLNDSGRDFDCVRYSREDEARLGHKMMVKKWRTYKTAEEVLKKK